MIGYAWQAIAIMSLYALCLVWSAAAWVVVRRAGIAVGWKAVFAAGCLVAGPMLAAMVQTIVLWLFPAQPWSLYILTLFALPAAVCLPAALTLRRADAIAFGRLLITTAMRNPSLLIGLPLFAVVCGMLALPLFLLPLHGNDPLEYMQLGRAFHEHRDARIYPILTALPNSGFIAPWTHPPIYGVLIAIAFALQGGAAVAGAAKLIGLWFAAATALLAAGLVHAADKRASWRVWLTPFGVLTVPLFFELVQNAHIDAMRLAAFSLAIALASHFVIQGTRTSAVMAGAGIGLAMMAHSIGILAPVIAVPLIVVCWRRPISQLVIGLTIIACIAGTMAAPHYVRNIFIFGNAIQDTVPVWDIPSLRVTEFLRVTRGLETLFDRLHNGIIAPVLKPATLGYVVLIGALLSPAVIWARVRQQGASGLAAELYKGRGGSVAIHLCVATAGFVALIILSAVAGSDLAVKNARYLATIVPIAIAAVMIGIGQLVPDHSFVRSAHHLRSKMVTVLDAIRRHGPKRFYPPRRDPPATANISGDGYRTARYAGLASVIVVAFVVQAQLAMAIRISVGFVAVYFNSTALLLDRMRESEHMKRNGSSLDDAVVDMDVLRNVPASETVLTFRQASLGFYTTSNFVFHADRKLVDLFKIQDAVELHKALSALDIRWIHTPNYALPEINNSAFSALIASPALVRPIIRSAGWGLYLLQALETGTTVTRLAEAAPYARPAVPVYATTEEGSGMVDGRRASLVIDTVNGFGELRRERSMVRQLDRWDVLLSRPAVTRSSPVDSNASDFTLTNDPVHLVASLSGKGLAEVVVEYVSHQPTIADLQAADVTSYKPVLTREVIWSGVLRDQPQAVGGWLVPLASLGAVTDLVTHRRGARILFRLRDGEVLRVHGWTADSIRFAQSRARDRAIEDAIQNGWLFSATAAHPTRGIRISTPASQTPPPPNWPFAPIGIERLTSAPVTLAMPPLYPELPATGEASARSALSRLADAQAAGPLRLLIKLGLKGFGRVALQLSIVCASSVAPEDKELAQWSSGGTANTGEKALRRMATPLQLWGDRVEQVTWHEALPCVPRSVRLLLQNSIQPRVTIEEVLQNPERQRVGFVDVYHAEVALVGGETPATAVNIPLKTRPVIPEIPLTGVPAR